MTFEERNKHINHAIEELLDLMDDAAHSAAALSALLAPIDEAGVKYFARLCTYQTDYGPQTIAELQRMGFVMKVKE